jgi:stage V sporulation protein SpoVS
MARASLFVLVALLTACGRPGAAPSASADRHFACAAVVPEAVRAKYFSRYQAIEAKGVGSAAKCIFDQPGRVTSATIEVRCTPRYTDGQIQEEQARMRALLKDQYEEVTPPLGRAAWIRTTGNQVVFWDAETNCKVDVTWDEGQPTLALARDVEAALR